MTNHRQNAGDAVLENVRDFLSDSAEELTEAGRDILNFHCIESFPDSPIDNRRPQSLCETDTSTTSPFTVAPERNTMNR